MNALLRTAIIGVSLSLPASAQTSTWIAPGVGSPPGPANWTDPANWDNDHAPNAVTAIAILPGRPTSGGSGQFARAQIASSATIELDRIEYRLQHMPQPVPLFPPVLTIHGRLTLAGQGIVASREGDLAGGYQSTIQVLGGGLELRNQAVADAVRQFTIGNAQGPAIGSTLRLRDASRLETTSVAIFSKGLVELLDRSAINHASLTTNGAGTIAFRDDSAARNATAYLGPLGTLIVADRADVSDLQVRTFAGRPGGTLDLSGAGGPVTLGATVGEFTLKLGGNHLAFAHDLPEMRLGGIVEGTGGLIWDRAGKLTLANANTYTGITEVRRGTLHLELGRVAGTIVADGATLTGWADVRGSLTNSGRVSPSDPYATNASTSGRLTIQGNYTQTATGALAIDIFSPTAFDRITVDGNAVLDGALNLAVAGGTVPVGTTAFDFLTAGAVSGQFSSVTGLPRYGAALASRIAYSPAKVSLEITQRPFAGFGNTAASSALGGHLDATVAGSTGALGPLLTQLNTLPEAGQVTAALTALSPDRYGALASEAVLSAVAHQVARERRLAAPGPDKGRGLELFFDAGRRSAEFQSVAGLPHAGASASSGTAGGIWRRAGFALGTSFTQENASLDFDGQGSRGERKSKAISVYFRHSGGRLQLTAAATRSADDYDLQRRIAFSGFLQTAAARTSGTRTDLAVGAGLAFPTEKWVVTPQVGLIASRLGIDNFAETGAEGANLTISDWSIRSLQSRVGFDLQMKGDGPWTPRLSATWLHESRDNRSFRAATAGGPGYQVPGRPADDNLLTAAAGFDWRLTRNALLHASLGGTWGDQSRLRSDFSAGLSIRF